MSLTSNFDFCVELGIASVKEIFHLAFKSEDRYPHTVGPVTRTYSGETLTITVQIHDDETDAADLSFQNPKHILFSFPFDVTVQIPTAPDPSLSQITLKCRVSVPALLDTWAEDGEDVLGLNFANVTPADVVVETLAGLPSIDINNFIAAIHSRYDQIQHVYTAPSAFGTNTLILYDGNRDNTLVPPNLATPFEISAALETPGGTEFLKVTAPIHVDVPLPSGFGTYTSYGRVIFWRQVVRSDTKIVVNMGAEPGDPTLKTQVELDNAHPARPQVIAALQPMLVSTLAGYGPVTEPAFSEAAAGEILKGEITNYLKVRKYPVYSPKSGDPTIVLSTPVGFLLVAEGVLAILITRRDASVEDFAPDNFLGGNELALAVGEGQIRKQIDDAIKEEFPGLASGGHEINTAEGSATLHELNVSLADAGEHDQDRGHLWVTGQAEVHIDCWPDPDVSFEGPIFINATPTNEDGQCGLTVQAVAGDFDIDESCCDVFLDLIIPIVGWIMLAIVESTINSVGGRLIDEITSSQNRKLAPVPPVVNGIAEVTACLIDVIVTRQGFIFPGTISIRRLGESFEDRKANKDLPKP
jgi:hypothetical protein